MVNIYEISMLVFLKEDIHVDDSITRICEFIDKFLSSDQETLKFHRENRFKNYSFCSFYPLEKDMVYKRNRNYTLRIRTTDSSLASLFNEKMVNTYTDSVKGLTSEIKILRKRFIDRIYTITPAIIKNEEGYWKGILTVEDYERRIKENLIKKYRNITGEEIPNDHELFTSIEFNNRKPVKFKYKGRKLLGDKITITMNQDELSQRVAHMSMGTGIGEINARGGGYINSRCL